MGEQSHDRLEIDTVLCEMTPSICDVVAGRSGESTVNPNDHRVASPSGSISSGEIRDDSDEECKSNKVPSSAKCKPIHYDNVRRDNRRLGAGRDASHKFDSFGDLQRPHLTVEQINMRILKIPPSEILSDLSNRDLRCWLSYVHELDQEQVRLAANRRKLLDEMTGMHKQELSMLCRSTDSLASDGGANLLSLPFGRDVLNFLCEKGKEGELKNINGALLPNNTAVTSTVQQRMNPMVPFSTASNYIAPSSITTSQLIAEQSRAHNIMPQNLPPILSSQFSMPPPPVFTVPPPVIIRPMSHDMDGPRTSLMHGMTNLPPADNAIASSSTIVFPPPYNTPPPLRPVNSANILRPYSINHQLNMSDEHKNNWEPHANDFGRVEQAYASEDSVLQAPFPLSHFVDTNQRINFPNLFSAHPSRGGVLGFNHKDSSPPPFNRLETNIGGGKFAIRYPWNRNRMVSSSQNALRRLVGQSSRAREFKTNDYNQDVKMDSPPPANGINDSLTVDVNGSVAENPVDSLPQEKVM